MNAKEVLESFKKDLSHFFDCINFGKSALDAEAISFMNEIGSRAEKLVEAGRVSVLKDFDNMCQADSFVGFNEIEWNAIKRFFDFNKQVSGWDK